MSNTKKDCRLKTEKTDWEVNYRGTELQHPIQLKTKFLVERK